MKYSEDPEIIEAIKKQFGEFDEKAIGQLDPETIWEEFFANPKDATYAQRFLDYIGDSHAKMLSLIGKAYEIEHAKMKKKHFEITQEFQRKIRDIGDYSWLVDKKTGKFTDGAKIRQKYGPDSKEYEFHLYINGLLLPFSQTVKLINQGYLPSVPNDNRDWKEILQDSVAWKQIKEKEFVEVTESGDIRDILTLPFASKIAQKPTKPTKELLAFSKDMEEVTKKRVRKINNYRIEFNKRTGIENEKIREENEKIHAESVNYNLEKTIPAFLESLMNYQFKQEFEGDALLTKELIAREDIERSGWSVSSLHDKLVKKAFGEDKLITEKGSGSKLYEQYSDWLKRVFYEDYNKNEGNFGRVMNIVMQYTSLNTLGLNWSSGIGNKLYGEAMQLIEGYAGPYYDLSDYRQAWTTLNVNSMKYYRLLHKEDAILEDKDASIMKMYDVIQDTRELITNGPVESKLKKSAKAISALYFFNDIGEFTLQNSLLLAMMKKQKVKKGKEEISLYDAYEMKNGRLQLQEGVSNLDGTTFTDDNFAAFRNRVMAVNQNLHGIYTKEHSAALQKYALGRAAMQFKKWLRPGWTRRWGTRFGDPFFNERLNRTDQGSYTQTIKFAKDLATDSANLNRNLRLYWNKLSSNEKADIHRTYTELLAFIGVSLLGFGLSNLEDDDDKVRSKWMATLLYQQSRLQMELVTYTPLGVFDEYRKMRKSPMAIFSTYDKIAQLGLHVFDIPVAYLTGDTDRLRYSRGPFKGDMKVYQDFLQSTPILNKYRQWEMLNNKTRYYRLY